MRRSVEQIISGSPVSDGAGVRLTRLLGGGERNMLDPFLLFDVFDSDQPQDYIAGFPPHPHRGFATFTWMLNGRMEHRDNVGNSGMIETGGVQWMHAGRGIVHAEMPQQKSGLLRGTQLWVNLPAAAKMSAPFYQDMAVADLPVEERGAGVQVRVLAGVTSSGARSPVVPEHTWPLLLDVALAANAAFVEPVAADRAGMVWVANGSVEVAGERGSQQVAAGQLAVLGDEPAATGPGRHRIELRAVGAEPARLLFASAVRLQEPVARGGPFVMNSRAEIEQAFADYRSGALDGEYYIPGQKNAGEESDG